MLICIRPQLTGCRSTLSFSRVVVWTFLAAQLTLQPTKLMIVATMIMIVMIMVVDCLIISVFFFSADFACEFSCPSVCLSVCLFVCLFVCLSVCLSIYLSVCLSIRLSVCLSVGHSVYILISPPCKNSTFISASRLNHPRRGSCQICKESSWAVSPEHLKTNRRVIHQLSWTACRVRQRQASALRHI